MEGFALQHQHGKAKVRVGRLWRGATSQEHRFVEWNVSVSITSFVLPAFTDGDNSKIVATDSIKNTVSLASTQSELLAVERLFLVLCLLVGSCTPQDLIICRFLLFSHSRNRKLCQFNVRDELDLRILAPNRLSHNNEVCEICSWREEGVLVEFSSKLPQTCTQDIVSKDCFLPPDPAHWLVCTGFYSHSAIRTVLELQ